MMLLLVFLFCALLQAHQPPPSPLLIRPTRAPVPRPKKTTQNTTTESNGDSTTAAILCASGAAFLLMAGALAVAIVYCRRAKRTATQTQYELIE